MKYYFYLAVITIFSHLSCAQTKDNQVPEDEITKILFIGNSYLYYNSAPEIFNAMSSEKFPNRKIVTKLISGGGLTLANHLENEETLKVIQSEKWDYVVLQEQSGLGSGVFIDNEKYLGSREPFYSSSRALDYEIKKVGAKTVFLMTWSGKSQPEIQNHLTYAYSTIAKELDAFLIPVGLVWDNARQNNEFDLYSDDGYHPSIYGSYLVASSIFSTIHKTNPSGISGDLTGYSVDETGDKSWVKAKLSSLSKSESEFIHSAVWDNYISLEKQNGFPKIVEPKKEYVLPELPKGDTISKDDLYGSWTGSSRFDFVSDGLRLNFSKIKDERIVEVNILREGKNIKTKIVSENISNNSISINFQDEDGRIRELNMVKKGVNLIGLIIGTKGNYIKYDNIKFSRH